jgi:ABC-2 type transport system ATP-binding protein
MNPFAIRTENLRRDFPSICAVDDLSLEVPTGSIFGFLGPNGAGKTTTIRLLLGLLEPTAGKAEVLGFDTRTEAGAIRERSGALLEHSGLYERLSAADNLEFYGRVWRIPPEERRKRIKELLGQLGLWERRDELASTWSRGMKQKLAVARTLLHRPDLIFLDEPTAGLDPVAATALRADLASLVERAGVTVFLTTHNLAEAEKLCHQVGIIRQGRLLAVGPLEQLRQQTGGPRLHVRGDGFSERLLAELNSRPEVASTGLEKGLLTIGLHEKVETAPLISLLVSRGVQVEEVIKNHTSLEDVFLTLMEENQPRPEEPRP